MNGFIILFTILYFILLYKALTIVLFQLLVAPVSQFEFHAALVLGCLHFGLFVFGFIMLKVVSSFGLFAIAI